MTEDKPKRFPIPHPGVLLPVALVLVVIAVGLSVWMPYHRRQVAIREIERAGGTVGYRKSGPDWLRDLVGDEWMEGFGFHRVWAVDIQDQPISDDGLKHLNELTNLSCLWLNNAQISDAGLKQLSGLTGLYYLQLEGAHVGNGDGDA